mgnify:CR=1 FL=1
MQWSILAENAPNHNLLVLVDYQALRVTFHHNPLGEGETAIPILAGMGPCHYTPDIVTDIRNNLIWDFRQRRTQILNNTWSNVVKNLLFLRPTQRRQGTVGKVRGKVYAQGNYSLNEQTWLSQGNQEQPFLASPVDTTDAHRCPTSGSRGGSTSLDVIDQQYLSMITLPASSCP